MRWRKRENDGACGVYACVMYMCLNKAYISSVTSVIKLPLKIKHKKNDVYTIVCISIDVYM